MSLLIGFDDTASGHDAIALGLQIAAKDGEHLVVACAFPDDTRGLLVAMQDHKWIEEVRSVAERKLDSARRLVGQRPDVDYRAIGPGTASRGLHELAEEIRPRLLVVGSSEHAAFGRIAPGSTVESLLHGAPCPVAVAPRGYREQPEDIRTLAVAYDGTAAADEAVHFATEAARRRGASVQLIAVTPRFSDEMQTKLDDALAAIPPDVETHGKIVVSANVVQTLADLPGEQPDVLICGSRGYGVPRQVLLGSVSNRVIRNAAFPVVVVSRQAEAIQNTSSGA